MITERSVTVRVADGIDLQAQLGIPAGSRGGVALCHPHPLYGGDMDNPVVIRAAEVCAEVGLATLRLNFRGVGGSTGTHDDGRGEQDDLRAALAELGRVLPAGAPLAAVGYSFGGTIAARVAAGTPLAGLALIAPPLAMPSLAALGDLAAVHGPILVVAGTADPYCPIGALEAVKNALPQAVVRTVEGADHFFFGKLFPLGAIVAEWARGVGTGA